ncbi:MAG: amino acid permease, partial [Terriglobales bacterium]
AYVARALGPQWGFHATAAYWLACWTGNVAIAIAAIGYLAHFYPELARALPLAAAAVALIWLLTLANVLGPRRVCQIESATFFVGVIPIIVVIVGGAWAFHGTTFYAAWNVSGEAAWRSLPPALVLMFWAFAGVESASIATALVKNPERNVARATYYGVLIAAGVYLLGCGVIMGLLPARVLARSTAPFADAARLLLGSTAAAVLAAAVAILALIKIVGTLAGWILLTAETGEAGAAHRLFPQVFARRGWNLVIAGVLMSAGVAATVSPTLGEQFGKLIAVSVVLMLLLYIYACLALWRVAKRERGWALAGIVFCAGVIALSGADMLLWSAIVLVCVFPLYYCRGPRARAAGSELV